MYKTIVTQKYRLDGAPTDMPVDNACLSWLQDVPTVSIMHQYSTVLCLPILLSHNNLLIFILILILIVKFWSAVRFMCLEDWWFILKLTYFHSPPRRYYIIPYQTRQQQHQQQQRRQRKETQSVFKYTYSHSHSHSHNIIESNSDNNFLLLRSYITLWDICWTLASFPIPDRRT